MIEDLSAWQLWLLSLPSMCVFYLMVCLINAHKRRLCKWEIKTLGNWAYLLFLGSSVFTWAAAWQYQTLPGWDKLMMDLAACLYFGQRGWRIANVRRRQQQEQ